MCIELKGLRLSKPAAASPDGPDIKRERVWPPRPQAPPPRDRKLRAGNPEEKAATQRDEVNGKWGCEKLVNGERKVVNVSTVCF